MAVDYSAMIREAAKKISTNSGNQTASDSSDQTAGIQIERHDAETIQGQAKSGLIVA